MKKITLKPLLGNSLILISSIGMIAYPAHSEPRPTKIKQCADTFIKRLGTRLEDGSTGKPIANSGTSIILTNGVYLVSYNVIKSLQNSQVRDKVKVCLLSIPKNCPPGDNRGKIYSLMNYRTGGYVEMADSQHMCGGA